MKSLLLRKFFSPYFYRSTKLFHQLQRSFNTENLKYGTQKSDNIATGCKKNKDLGQPTWFSHPHIFSLENNPEKIIFEDQVTPWITKSEFEERRNNYVKYLGNYQNIYFSTKLTAEEKSRLAKDLINLEPKKSQGSVENFIAIIPSSVLTFMSPDVRHNFKQSSDFLYLTGYDPKYIKTQMFYYHDVLNIV
jgi:hypothetical protein